MSYFLAYYHEHVYYRQHQGPAQNHEDLRQAAVQVTLTLASPALALYLEFFFLEVEKLVHVQYDVTQGCERSPQFLLKVLSS